MTRHVTQMGIEDVAHYTEEERARVVASYPLHEREARARGVPVLGSGRVFPVAEETLLVEPFDPPPHWALLGGLDFGWDHPFAAVLLAWDRDEDVVTVMRTLRVRNEVPSAHAAALKPWGKVLYAWPHDGLQHDKGSGETLAAQYRAQGLDLLPERATHPDGGHGLEAGLLALLERMRAGKLKVLSTLTDWREEFRLYHRKDGLVVKERDDLMSATRIAHMMLRHARPTHATPWREIDRRWIV